MRCTLRDTLCASKQDPQRSDVYRTLHSNGSRSVHASAPRSRSSCLPLASIVGTVLYAVPLAFGSCEEEWMATAGRGEGGVGQRSAEQTANRINYCGSLQPAHCLPCPCPLTVYSGPSCLASPAGVGVWVRSPSPSAGGGGLVSRPRPGRPPAAVCEGPASHPVGYLVSGRADETRDHPVPSRWATGH